MNKLLFAIIFTALLLVGCSKENTEMSSSPQESTVSAEDTATKSLPEDSDSFSGGGSDIICYAHNLMYHSIDNTLINYVGYEAFNGWLDTLSPPNGNCGSSVQEDCNIKGFIEYFQIPKEEFISITRNNLDEEFLAENDGLTVYSSDQIDALYSGDQQQINEAFCGSLAFVNETDGKLYSIYWLADHSAEDYAAAKLPLDQVEEVLQTASKKEYSAQSERANLIESKLTQAYTLEEAALAEEENSAKESVPANTEESEPVEESSETTEDHPESSVEVSEEPVEGNTVE